MNFSLKIIKNESLIKMNEWGKNNAMQKKRFSSCHIHAYVWLNNNNNNKKIPCLDDIVQLKYFFEKKWSNYFQEYFIFFFKLCSVWYSQKSFALWKHYHHFSTTYVIAGSFYLEKKRFLRLRFLFILKFMFNIQFSNKKFFYWNFI